jgi:hypothetical protein
MLSASPIRNPRIGITLRTPVTIERAMLTAISPTPITIDCAAWNRTNRFSFSTTRKMTPVSGPSTYASAPATLGASPVLWVVGRSDMGNLLVLVGWGGSRSREARSRDGTTAVICHVLRAGRRRMAAPAAEPGTLK